MWPNAKLWCMCVCVWFVCIFSINFVHGNTVSQYQKVVHSHGQGLRWTHVFHRRGAEKLGVLSMEGLFCYTVLGPSSHDRMPLLLWVPWRCNGSWQRAWNGVKLFTTWLGCKQESTGKGSHDLHERSASPFPVSLSMAHSQVCLQIHV